MQIRLQSYLVLITTSVKTRCTPKTSDAGVAAELQAMIFLVDWQSILFTNNFSSETESFPFPFFQLPLVINQNGLE